MKKIFLSLFLVSIAVTVFATDISQDDKFFAALRNCELYSNNGSVTTEGTNTAYKNRILGWKNGKCAYQEEVNFMGIVANVNCSFTKTQIDELVNVMQAYSTVQKYSGKEEDISNLQEAQNNPVVRIWNKYMQDPSVCNMDIGGSVLEK